MALIDEDGRLLGVVNVIDLLVVLLVLAVAVAGFALVDPFAAASESTRYATVDLGEQQPYVAEQISAGDVVRPPDAPRNATVRDVYVGPAAGGNVSVSVRVQINGTLTEAGVTGQQFEYAGDRIRQGSSFSLETDDYSASGTITRLDRTGTRLETSTHRVRLEATVAPSIARQLQAGKTIAFAGQTGATIEQVHVGPGEKASSRHVVAVVSARTIQESDGRHFGAHPLDIGRSVTLDLNAYSLTGEIDAIGEDDTRIRTATTPVMLEVTVPNRVAQRVVTGDTYDLANDTVATVESVRRYPGPNDNQRQLYVGLSLTTPVRDGERYFGSTQVAIGQSIPFRTADYAIAGTVEAFDATVETAKRKVAIESTVSRTVANAIEVGDAYTLSGQEIATVRSIEVYPNGEPGTRRVRIGLDLQTVTRDDWSYFGTQRVAIGSSVPFATEGYQLSGTIVGTGAYAPEGETTPRTITVKVSNVDPEFADGIEVGMTERSIERTTARILEKRSEPASVILTSESGEIFERTHPRNKDVYLTVEVEVRELADGYQFHARTLEEGTTITLHFQTLTVQGTVTDIQTGS